MDKQAKINPAETCNWRPITGQNSQHRKVDWSPESQQQGPIKSPEKDQISPENQAENGPAISPETAQRNPKKTGQIGNNGPGRNITYRARNKDQREATQLTKVRPKEWSSKEKSSKPKTHQIKNWTQPKKLRTRNCPEIQGEPNPSSNKTVQ